MVRRKTLGLLAAGVLAGIGAVASSKSPGSAPVPSLAAPEKGRIPVAFVLTDGAVMIDFAGPWEVFQDVYVPSRGPDDSAPFELFTVSESKKPIQISGGMIVVPDRTFDDAPQPRVIVIPAQSGSPKMQEWIRKASARADVVFSVCTGAFHLAETGLLSGRSATTHHSSYRKFAMQYPDIRLERGVRYVDDGKFATAGGLSSGIDLALHVVERYFGREVASRTAYQMEYQGQGWLNPESNAVYRTARQSTESQPLCVVCEMDIDTATAPKSVFKNKTYFFCSTDHKAQFDAAPEKWTAAQ
jgi:transcriptional regulator GlxA family with amidase domain